MACALPLVPPSSPFPLCLLPALLDHDESAWVELEQWATPLIRCYCRRRGLGAADADAIGQQVLLIVFCHLEQFRPDHGADGFRRWLLRITQNQVAELRRQRRPVLFAPAALERLPAHAAACGEPGTAADPRAQRIHSAVRQVRAEFGENAWVAFRLIVEGEWTAAAAGAALGFRPGTVRVLKYRIRDRLRQMLDE